MLFLLFEDPRLHKLTGSSENTDFIRTTFDLLGQIFCSRILEKEFSSGIYLPSERIVSIHSEYSQNSRYRESVIQIIESLSKKYPELENSFELYNSYEKVSWSTFCFIVGKRIPDFDFIKFGLLLEKLFKKDDPPIVSRLLFDFHSTVEWQEYMTRKMNNSRLKKGLSGRDV